MHSSLNRGEAKGERLHKFVYFEIERSIVERREQSECENRNRVLQQRYQVDLAIGESAI